MTKKIELKDRFKILLDPLSHGGNMSSLLVEVEVLDEQSAPHLVPDEDVDLEIDVVVLKVLSQQEVEWGGGSLVDHGNWGEGIPEFMSIVSVNGSPWEHTACGEPVDFVDE